MGSEFVKECTSVLQAAEILCPEFSSFLKLSVFRKRSSWSTWWEIHSVSLQKRVKMWWLVRLRLTGVQTWQLLIILLFLFKLSRYLN